MKLKGHKNLIAGDATVMIRPGSFRWRPSAEMFFGLIPNTSANKVMLRGQDRFADYFKRISNYHRLERHQ